MSAASALITSGAPYRLREFHAFEAAGSRFLYAVPSGAIFALNAIGQEILERVQERSPNAEELMEWLLSRGHQRWDVETALMELEESEVIMRGDSLPEFPKMPARTFPLQRIVLNLTNQCNLACGYCYEYSADKISKTDGKPKYMGMEVSQSAIDMLIQESAERPSIHVTFFGGETLMNFPLLRETVRYAKDKSAEAGKNVEFSLTTNATLITEQIADFLAEHRIGVTVSIDGDQELNDKMRVFHDGRGSYNVIVPKIKNLLKKHRTNSIGARVTLTSQVSDVKKIYRHLTTELGFDSVGFSPATASPDRLYHIGAQKMDNILDSFAELAREYRDFAIEGKQHGITNVSDTLKELNSGVSKAYPCGAGVGLLGVGTAGDVSLCHRFVDSPVEIGRA